MIKKFSTKLFSSLVVTLFFCFVLVNGDNDENNYDEESGKAYLKKINADIQVKTTENVLAAWAYESNITDENLKKQLEVLADLANFTKEIWKETIKYPWQTFTDPDVKRQFKKFSVLGTAILSPDKYEKFNKIVSDMQSVYGKAKVCNYHNRTNCSLQIEPELTEIFVKSRDPDELRYYWEQWRNTAGKPVKKLFKEYVQLSNEAAVLNNFTDNADFWLKDYEANDFKEQVENLWQQVKPLYLQLHAYVRRRLREQYGEQHVTKRGPIPAHLLGNMWAQSWDNTFDITVPYPQKPSLDVTESMIAQGYTPLRMFKLAEEFFTSLDLSPMPETFWKNSILEKPNDGRDLICHASAWDFYDGQDFRIKQCTRLAKEDLKIVHHEMGHIQYFLQYKNQPLVYKEGTNPGFHEAVGDVMALSVSTPKHLKKIGLLNTTEDDAEYEINQLFSMALDKIAFLPFGYLMDQWRWKVFQGEITHREYNCEWWKMRENYQGLSPSVLRTEEDFDPGAKYHTVGNVPYMRYFVSFIIQFQFHRSLCIAAKQFDPNNPASKPLHKCDIYQSKEAGALLKKMLQMGSSKPWPDAMEVMTGQRKMDARPLLEYFALLQTWLENENKKTDEYIGWESSDLGCPWEDLDKASGTKVSTKTEGNLEDGDFAYSNAEFVRQYDNSFGLPEYLEELKPSYQELLHESKEEEYDNNHVWPSKSRYNFMNDRYIYRSKKLSDPNILNFSKLRRVEKRLKKHNEKYQNFPTFCTFQKLVKKHRKNLKAACKSREGKITSRRSCQGNAKNVKKVKDKNSQGLASKWDLSVVKRSFKSRHNKAKHDKEKPKNKMRLDMLSKNIRKKELRRSSKVNPKNVRSIKFKKLFAHFTNDDTKTNKKEKHKKTKVKKCIRLGPNVIQSKEDKNVDENEKENVGKIFIINRKSAGHGKRKVDLIDGTGFRYVGYNFAEGRGEDMNRLNSVNRNNVRYVRDRLLCKLNSKSGVPVVKRSSEKAESKEKAKTEKSKDQNKSNLDKKNKEDKVKCKSNLKTDSNKLVVSNYYNFNSKSGGPIKMSLSSYNSNLKPDKINFLYDKLTEKNSNNQYSKSVCSNIENNYGRSMNEVKLKPPGMENVGINNVELLWRAEIVKTEAENMLKNSNISERLPHVSTSLDWTVPPEHFNYIKEFNLTTHNDKPTRDSLCYKLQRGKFLKRGQSTKANSKLLKQYKRSKDSNSKTGLMTLNSPYSSYNYILEDIIPEGYSLSKKLSSISWKNPPNKFDNLKGNNLQNFVRKMS